MGSASHPGTRDLPPSSSGPKPHCPPPLRSVSSPCQRCLQTYPESHRLSPPWASSHHLPGLPQLGHSGLCPGPRLLLTDSSPQSVLHSRPPPHPPLPLRPPEGASAPESGPVPPLPTTLQGSLVTQGKSPSLPRRTTDPACPALPSPSFPSSLAAAPWASLSTLCLFICSVYRQPPALGCEVGTVPKRRAELGT